MKKNNFAFLALVLTGLLAAFSPSCFADMYETAENTTYTDSTELPSYGKVVGTKTLSGLTNLTLGWIEIPKNIINTTNESNIFFGIFGGGFKGLVNTAGRLGVGLADLLTFPLPTKPIANPIYVWDNFDVDTQYGDVFRLQDTK
jgi:putative exosortase-associated protein (TIGR04073 family)